MFVDISFSSRGSHRRSPGVFLLPGTGCVRLSYGAQLTPNLLEQNDVTEYLDQNYESSFLHH